MKLKVPGPPNVLITGILRDVRCGPGTTAPAKCATANAVSGADYTGELQAGASAAHDRPAGTRPRTGGGTDAATVQDNTLNATFPLRHHGQHDDGLDLHAQHERERARAGPRGRRQACDLADRPDLR